MKEFLEHIQQDLRSLLRLTEEAQEDLQRGFLEEDYPDNLTNKVDFLQGQMEDAFGDLDTIQNLIISIDKSIEVMVEKLEWEKLSPHKGV